MNLIVSAILGVLTGKAGERIGGTVASVTELGAAAAVAGPVVFWLMDHKAEEFISVTYGDLAFWCAILGGLVFLVTRLVHRAPPPS